MIPKRGYGLILTWVRHECRNHSTPATDTVGLLVEQLRRMGPVSCWESEQRAEREGEFYIVALSVSKDSNSYEWAKQNALRQRSFGIISRIIVGSMTTGWYLADLDGKPDPQRPVRI